MVGVEEERGSQNSKIRLGDFLLFVTRFVLMETVKIKPNYLNERFSISSMSVLNLLPVLTKPEEGWSLLRIREV